MRSELESKTEGTAMRILQGFAICMHWYDEYNGICTSISESDAYGRHDAKNCAKFDISFWLFRWQTSKVYLALQCEILHFNTRKTIHYTWECNITISTNKNIHML